MCKMAAEAGISSNEAASEVAASPDVVFLRGFYASPLGGALKRRLRGLCAGYFGACKQSTIVGLGYATPLLRPLLTGLSQTENRVISLMPAPQGAIYWPVDSDNLTVLADSSQLPLHPSSVQYMVMMHALEHEPYPSDCLREAWRVLAPGGKLLLVMPRSYGLWRWLGDTPWKHSAHASSKTLRHTLRTIGFTWVCQHALCAVPPVQHHALARVWFWLDRTVCFACPWLASVVVIEAEKHIYASIRSPAKAPQRKPLLAPAGATNLSAYKKTH